MKSCLLAFRTSQAAGAERIGFQLAQGLKNDFAIEIGLLSKKTSGAFAQNFPVRGWWAFLFGRYQLIHTHLFLPGFIIRLRRVFDSSFSWVHTVHYCAYQGQRWGRLKAFLDRHWIFPKADRLVAVSAETTRMIGNQSNRLEIENGVDLVEQRLPGAAFHKSGPIIGTVAMLRTEKGIEELISSMPLVLEKYPAAQLLVAGAGPEQGRLEGLIKKKRLHHQVKLLGFVEDTQTFLKSLDIYVSASRTESFGLAILEAMQFSLPIVATRVGVVDFLLGKGEFGILIPSSPQLGKEFSQAIDSILADREGWQRRSQQGLFFNRGRLLTSRMVNDYRKLYQRMLGPGICMIAPIVTQATGGVQKQIWLQSRQLSELGYRVFILQRRDPNLAEVAGRWTHVEFLSTPNPFAGWAVDSDWALRMRGLLFLLGGIWQIFRNRHRLLLIHGHQLFSAALLGALAKKLFGTRLLIKVTASGVLGEMRELKRLPFLKIRRLAFRQIDRLIVLTQEMYNEMRELGFSEATLALIPNSVAIPVSSRLTVAHHRNEPMRILYCGRLSREKALDSLLEAAAQLIRQGVPCVIDLVGGSYGGRDTTQELMALAKSLGIESVVHFHGKQKEVERFYLAADVFVLPSQSEGMSNSLLEALAYGLPCLASDIVPNQTLIEHAVNGLLFKQGNAEDLAGQLRQIALDQQKGGLESARLGQAARRRVESKFSDEAIAQKLNQLYRTLIPPQFFVGGLSL